MAFFGFIPSESLLNNVQTSIAKKNSKEVLYPLRDEIALQVNEEIIDAILTNVVQHFPQSEKKETAEKLANFVKSSAPGSAPALASLTQLVQDSSLKPLFSMICHPWYGLLSSTVSSISRTTAGVLSPGTTAKFSSSAAFALA